MSLNRDSILTAPVKLKRVEVQVPEWGGSVYVRELLADERDILELEWERTKRKNFRARMVLACACDENGVDLFKMEDLLAVSKKESTAVGRICEEAFRLNRFTKEEVDQLEKNFESAPADAS
jgi:hypothetical protein